MTTKLKFIIAWPSKEKQIKIADFENVFFGH